MFSLKIIKIRKILFLWFLFGIISQPVNLALANTPNVILTLSSGTSLGTYFQIGNIFCRFINLKNSDSGIKCINKASAGSEQNVALVLDEGKSSIGISQADVILNNPNFANLRAIAFLYDEAVFVVASANSSVKVFNDIIDQNFINIGSPYAGENFTAKEIIKAKGWTKESFLQFGRYEISSLIKSREVGASFFVGASFDERIPNEFIFHLIHKYDARLISMDDALIQNLSKNPAYSPFTIRGGIYPGQNFDVKTISTKAVLFANKDLPSDVVYNILKSTFGEKESLRNSHPAFKNSDIKSFFMRNNKIPLHEGAEKFLKEIESNPDSIDEKSLKR
jgi:TRAP transporter TAXI family solute receptor